jgi:hypothetical protein
MASAEEYTRHASPVLQSLGRLLPLRSNFDKEFLVKHRPLVLISVIGLAGATALSCASQSAATQPTEQQATTAPAPQQQPAQPQAAAAPVTPAQVAWADMTRPQRGQYMASVVMPKIKELFRSFDEKKFAEFNCRTCHGKDAKDRGFEMPNPNLFALPSTQEGWGELAKDKGQWMQFMSQQVKPQMAALLGVKEYDPKNPQPGTFGCNTCHPVKSP